ncbi:MAG: hypothetical protein WCB69_04680, partial [Pseudolabrys sp.]
ADASEPGHEQQLRQRAVHFAADELEEGHKVFRLHVHKMSPPAQQDAPPAETKNTSANSGEAIRRDVIGRSEAGQATLQMEW